MNKIINNIFHLVLVKGGELIFPLLTIPMLINALGLHGYGEYIFAQTIVSYLIIAVNFGFDDVGVRLISSAKSSEERSIFAINIIYVKLSLLLLIAILYFPLISLFDVDHKLYWYSFLLLVVDVINVYWFFQGIEKLKHFSLASIITKFIYLVCIWVFIKSPSDVAYVPVILFLTFSLGNSPALYYFLRYGISKFTAPDKKCMQTVFAAAKYVFLSNIVIAIKDKTGNIIAGAIIGKEALAVYDIINKLMLIANQPATIINTAFFPTFSRSHNSEIMKDVVKVLLLLSLAIILISIPFTWIFIPNFYSKFSPYLGAIQISFLSCIFYAISFFIGRNILVARGLMRLLFGGVIATSAFYLLSLSIAGYISGGFSVFTLVVISVLTYLFEMLYRIYVAKKWFVNI